MSEYRFSRIRLLKAFAPVCAALSLAFAILKVEPVAVVAVCGLLFLVPFFRRNSFPLLLLWLAIPLLGVIAQVPFISIGRLGSILLLPADVPYLLTVLFLIMAYALRPQDLVWTIKLDPFLSLFLGLIIVSTLIYTPVYGKMAIGEARKEYFFFLFPLLTTVSLRTFADLRRLITAVCFLAVCISIFAYVVFAQHPSANRYSIPAVGEGSLIALFAAFSILIFHANRVAVVNRFVDTLMLILLLSIVIMTRTRTTFLAGALGFLLLLGFRRGRGSFLLKSAGLAILFVLLTVALFKASPTLAQEFVKPVAGLLDPESDATGAWRIDGWRQLLAPLSETQLVFGKGVGSYSRWYRGTEEIVAEPHNAYVEIVLKFGLLGLLIYTLAALNFVTRMVHLKNKLPAGLGRACVESSLVNVAAAHASMLGYGFSVIILVFYGIGVSSSRVFVRGHPSDASEILDGEFC
jgi:O-antigen ligase